MEQHQGLEDAREQFRREFGRPFLWCEAVEPDEVRNLLWTLCRALRISPTPDPAGFVLATRRRFKHVPACEDPGAVLRRLGIPVPETTLVYTGFGYFPHLLWRFRGRDIIDFASALLGRVDTDWILDEHARWLLSYDQHNGIPRVEYLLVPNRR